MTMNAHWMPKDGEDALGLEPAHDPRPGEAADRHRAPYEGQVERGLLVGDVGDMGLPCEVDEQVADADLCQHMEEDCAAAEHHVAVLPLRDLPCSSSFERLQKLVPWLIV
ncbi:MAG: hypothetical protein JF564_06035 [Sphingomonas sp.]|nr:hypothetical protein [Sphingomonas sp.]